MWSCACKKLNKPDRWGKKLHQQSKWEEAGLKQALCWLHTLLCQAASASISSLLSCGVLTASSRVDPNWQPSWQVSSKICFQTRPALRRVKFPPSFLFWQGRTREVRSREFPPDYTKFRVRGDLSEELSFTLRWTEWTLWRSLAFKLGMRQEREWEKGERDDI